MFKVTVQKMKSSFVDIYNKCGQICSFLRIWLHLVKKSLIENFIFCVVSVTNTSFQVFWKKLARL